MDASLAYTPLWTDYCLTLDNFEDKLVFCQESLLKWKRAQDWKEMIYRERGYKEAFRFLWLNTSVALECLKCDKAKPMFRVAFMKHMKGLKWSHVIPFCFMSAEETAHLFVPNLLFYKAHLCVNNQSSTYSMLLEVLVAIEWFGLQRTDVLRMFTYCMWHFY